MSDPWWHTKVEEMHILYKCGFHVASLILLFDKRGGIDTLVVRELFNALSVDTSGSSIHFIKSKNYVIDANIYACNLYFGLYSVKNYILRGN